MIEVDAKIKKIRRMTLKQKRKYVSDKKIPVVKYYEEFYIIDHHHFVRACWETGIKKVQVKVIADFTGMSEHSLMHEMKDRGWIYNRSLTGGKCDSMAWFPADIRCMADDPYRSLSWAVREAGGYPKTGKPFEEFEWADKLRQVIKIEDLRSNFNKAVKMALRHVKKSKK
jgi:hypothetical protein